METEEALKLIKTDLCPIRCEGENNMDECEARCEFKEAIKVIEALSEQRTGRWINIDDIESECSECGHREPNERFIFEDINFCAKCGVKMEEGD